MSFIPEKLDSFQEPPELEDAECFYYTNRFCILPARRMILCFCFQGLDYRQYVPITCIEYLKAAGRTVA